MVGIFLERIQQMIVAALIWPDILQRMLLQHSNFSIVNSAKLCHWFSRPHRTNRYFGTERWDIEKIQAMIEKSIDLRFAAIIERFGLRRPLYSQVACYGHFGENAKKCREQKDLAKGGKIKKEIVI